MQTVGPSLPLKGNIKVGTDAASMSLANMVQTSNNDRHHHSQNQQQQQQLQQQLQQPGVNPMGTSGGWTAQQSREYNDLIQQQLGGPPRDNSSDAVSVGSLGVPFQPGQSMEDRYERPTSAPPPGFVSNPDSHDRNRLAEEAIFGMAMKPSMNAAHPVATSHNSGLSAEDDAFSGVTGDSDSAERGFSLSNLVDALGSGLSDPVDDTGHADSLLRQRLADNPNLQRQTRHTASRLIGAPTASSSNGPPASAAAGGGVFTPSDHGAFGTQSRLFPSHEPQHPSESVMRGFPNSLSSPNRTPPRRGGDVSAAPDRREVSRRATTPVQMHPGQSRDHRSYPVSKDIGTNVDEPNDGESQFSGKNIPSAVVSKRIGDPFGSSGGTGGGGNDFYGNYGGGFNLQSTLNSQSKEFRPSSHFNEGNDGMSQHSSGTDISPHECEAELDQFLWELGGRSENSRTVAVLRASWLKPPEVRAECEQFGALESFRSEFAPKGIYFAAYYDIRSAELAASELQVRLQRVALLQGSSEDVLVRFCIPLNSSSQFDESQMIINGLADEINDAVLTSMLRSYGSIRSCIYQGPGSFLVEFQNLQDAKQASLELESSLPWGPNVSVEVSPRTPADRRRGRELLSTISRWRQGMNRKTPGNGQNSGDARRFGAPPFAPSAGGQQMGQLPTDGFNYGAGYGGAASRQPETVTQLIMGPDGRYTPVVVPNTMGMSSHGGQYSMDHRSGQQQIIHGPNGQIFISSGPPQHAFPQTTQSGYASGHGYDANRRGGGATPYYAHSVASDNISVHSGRSHGTHGTHMSHHSTAEDKDHRHLLLDLDAVDSGRDTRTSLMVRNIPNKYTQQMLLFEFTENGHGPGVIDFFYLPIDFKNRCNRGYAFINFVSHKDILAFHRRYFGKQWRTFNSDKICDITYARIQGKAAMLKRFENSALMDKDDEYKPLVFASDGPEKGKRLPFADPSTKPM